MAKLTTEEFIVHRGTVPLCTSRAFTSLGFQSRRTSKYRGYIVVRRSAEEMRSMRYQMANTDTDNTPVF